MVVVSGTVVVVSGTVVVVAGGAVVVVVVVVAGGFVVVVAGGAVVVVVGAVVVVVVVVGTGSACGVAAGRTAVSTSGAAGCSISGLRRAEKLAAATLAESDSGSTLLVSVWISSALLSAPTAAKPSAAIRITINDPAADM